MSFDFTKGYRGIINGTLNITIDNDGLLHTYDATAAPTVDDDADAGYSVGSRWIDVTNDEAYTLVDSTNGAAVWKNTTATGGGGGAPTDAEYLVLSADATLTDERVFTPGDGISVTDAGAGSTYTVDVDINSESTVTLASGDEILVYDVSGAVIGKTTAQDIADLAAGTTDHGALTGLGDDDHTQYHTDARALTWLGTRSTTDLSEGTNLYFTDERAQDAVGTILTDSSTIDFTYDDGAGTITASTIDSAIDHDALLNFVANEHIDWTQSGAGTIHASNYVDNDTTDHTLLSNIGTNTHAQIDTHIADSTIHFTEASIDHANILNVGTNTHAQIDTHIASTANPHSVTIDQVTPTTTKGDILVEDGSNVIRLPVGTDGQVLSANSAEASGLEWITGGGGGISAIADATDTDFTSLANGEIMRYDSSASDWINTDAVQIDETVALNPTSPISNPMFSFLIDSAGTNLIVNPKFENNITDGWTDSGTVTTSRDTGEQRVGSASLEMTSSAANAGVVHDPIAVSANTDYVFSCFVKGAAGGETINLRADLDVTGIVESSNPAFAGFVINDPVTTEWNRVTFGFTTGASDTSVDLYILSTAAGAQTMYIDAVQFEQKDLPTDTKDVAFASTYMDGDMGVGYTWSGAANNSTSSRTAGNKILAPLIDNNRGHFKMFTDGTIGRAFFDAKEVQFGNFANSRVEPFYPFTFVGEMKTNVLTSGVSAGIVNIRNDADGNALQVESEASGASALVISAPSVTSGAVMSVFAPADLTAMEAADGKFFTFAGKGQGLDMYTWFVNRVQMGALGFQFDKNVVIYGGGSQTSTNRSIVGTVSVTNGSPTVTGSGFLTDFVRGQTIRILVGGTPTNYVIASVDSDTQITLTTNYGQATNGSRQYDGLQSQYSPPVISLEGSYAAHGDAGTTGDFMYGIYASGGNGHLRVLKSSSLGERATPTADNDGHGLVTSRQVDDSTNSISASSAETTIIDGYTVPAYELRQGTAFRIKFSGDMDPLLAATTVIWRVKLGGTTILTSVAVQLGSINVIDFKGEIEILATSDTAQKSSISVNGKDTALSPGLTYSVCDNGTSSVDMRLDQELTVTAEFSDGSDMNIYFNTVEIL